MASRVPQNHVSKVLVLTKEDFSVTFALTRQMLQTQLGVLRVSGLDNAWAVPGAWQRVRVFPVSHATRVYFLLFLFYGSCRKGAESYLL